MDEATLKLAAHTIRNEMVCCDIYDQLGKFFDEAEYRALKRSSNYHAICHYGEWAARVLERLSREPACHPECLVHVTHWCDCPTLDKS